MLYNIIKCTPTTQTVVSKAATLRHGRRTLRLIRGEYANALPAGSKRLARHHGKDCIIVHDVTNDGRVNGDEIRYFIVEA